nr:hypothetical protein [uncultured bacterium]
MRGSASRTRPPFFTRKTSVPAAPRAANDREMTSWSFIPIMIFLFSSNRLFSQILGPFNSRKIFKDFEILRNQG